MKITLLSEDAIRLEPVPGMLTIEAPSADHGYSPFQMMGSGLAVCTWSILASWASNANLSADDLTIEVRWTFAENPHRVGTIETKYEWPSLPAARRKAAKRVAEMCTLHQTFHHPPEITIVDASAPAGQPEMAGAAS